MYHKFLLKALVGISMITYLANPLAPIVQPVVTLAQTTETTELVSISSDGELGNHSSSNPSISSDGRFVAFVSYADNLVEGDTNSKADIFVRDRQLGITERVSVSSMGEQGNFDSESPSISADGRFVVYSSHASNLVEGDTNLHLDVFVHDRETSETERVSVSSSGNQGTGGGSYYPSISGDGRYVVFSSNATNLVNGKTRSDSDVFKRDRQTGLTERISVSFTGEEGNKESRNPSISADGRFVVFGSSANNLIAQDTNQAGDIFIRNNSTGEVELISKSFSGEQANGTSNNPSTSADGQVVAFVSTASNLVDEESNDLMEIFVHDRQTGVPELISVSSEGHRANDFSQNPSISSDGYMVAFESFASNLVEKDKSWGGDIFVRNRQTGETERVSVSFSGEDANGSSRAASISANGCLVAFQSEASNLVKNDTNLFSDIFVRNRCIGEDNTLLPGEGTSDIIGQIPPAVTDLRVTPISKSTDQGSNIKFSWTVPEISGQHKPPIKYFDLRYSHDPISEETFQDAVQIEGEIVAEDPGKNQVWQPTSFEVDTYTRNYFAIKGRSENGEWSPLSNVFLLIDTGFRHNPDGYSFINKYSEEEMANLFQFTTEHLEKMFERDEVCEPIYQSFCVPTMLGEQFIKEVNQSYLNGVCLGMASTSLILFLNPGTIDDQLGDDFSEIDFLGVYPSLTIDLKFVNSHIAYYQATSKTKAYEDEWARQVQENEPNDIFYRLRDYFLGVTDEPMILVFHDPMQNEGVAHAVTPIALSLNGLEDDWWVLHVYDNNLPLEKEEERFFKFNPGENSWRSSGEAYTSARSDMGLVPLSIVYQEKQELPYDLRDQIRIWLEQNLNIVITNETGQRLGYLDDQFVNEIPESIVVPEFGSATGFVNPTYYFPSDSNYKFSITGNSLGEGSLYMNVDNRLINLSTNVYSKNSQIEFLVSSNGKSLSLSSNEQIEVSLELTHIGVETSTIRFNGIEVYPNTSIDVTGTEDGQSYFINHTGAKDIAYELNVEMRDSTGIYHYLLQDQVLRSGETYQVSKDNWNKSGEITLKIDKNGDGNFEKSILAEISGVEMVGDTSEITQVQDNSKTGLVLLIFGIIPVFIGGLGIIFYIRKRIA